jgi:hypothetical protein
LQKLLDFYKNFVTLSGMNPNDADRYASERQARLKLAYEVGALQGFIKWGIPGLSTVKVKDQAGYEAAVDAAIIRIAREAEKHSEL